MGLFKIIKKTKEREQEIRLLVLGLDNAGKTTILKKFIGEDTDKIAPTLGFNIKTVAYDEFKLNFWDVGGQKTIRAYWRNYFEKTDGIIWVVDSTDVPRLNETREELHSLLKQEKLIGASLLILCNKQDIEGALSMEQIKEVLDMTSHTTRHWAITPTSAITGQGVQEGIDWLIYDIASRIFVMN